MGLYKHTKNNINLLIAVFVTIAVIVVSILFYNIYIDERVSALTDHTFEQQVSSNANTFNLTFTAGINLIETTASMLPVSDYLRYIDFESKEHQFLEKYFDYMMVVEPSGHAVGSDGRTLDLSSRDYINQAMQGNTVVSEPIVSGFNQEPTIVIATPMSNNGEIIGVLAGFIYVKTINNMFGESIDGISANLIVDSEGNIVANGVLESDLYPLKNLFGCFESKGVEDTETLELLKKDVSFGITGDNSIRLEDEMQRVMYQPVGIKDWMILSIIPETVIYATTDDIINITAIVSIITVLVVGVFGIIINTSQRINLDKISQIAYKSELTGTNTIPKFKLDSKPFIKKNINKKFLMVKFDIENFRLVNEALGTDEGDRVLKSMAEAMVFGDAESCLCAHMHDDEFLVMVAYIDQEKAAGWRSQFVRRLYRILGEDFDYRLRIVVGYYYLVTNEDINISDAIEKANIAHRKAKATSATLSVYSDELLADAVKKKQIENRMEEALRNEEFIMVLQPELNLETGDMVGAEALVRWQAPDGPLRPDEFIPLFEQNGFIVKLDMYMFEQACKFLQRWIDSGRKAFILSVNFSRNHLYSIDFVSKLVKVCAQYEVSTEYLGIEITESSMLDNEADLLTIMDQLQSNGFKVLMDDFGSGYSSLGLLKSTPVDIIKLDRSFFNLASDRERSFAVVNSVIQLSKDLNIKTIAEGIETLEDIITLKRMGCNVIQGYYYAKPMSPETFKKFYDSDAGTLVI